MRETIEHGCVASGQAGELLCLADYPTKRIVVCRWRISLVPLPHVVKMKPMFSFRTKQKGQCVVRRDVRIGEGVLCLDRG